MARLPRRARRDRRPPGTAALPLDVRDDASITALAAALPDLLELAVVCAGAKTILDVPATLELLETLGVPVLGFRCDMFPGFYTRETDCAVQTRVESLGDATAILAVHRALMPDCGAVLAVPPPAASALPREEVEGWIAAALRNARAEGISGKATTPYLLERVVELSEGRSLEANAALAVHNASVAAELATVVAAVER